MKICFDCKPKKATNIIFYFNPTHLMQKIIIFDIEGRVHYFRPILSMAVQKPKVVYTHQYALISLVKEADVSQQ